MENKTKTNAQLFGDYYDVITITHAPKSFYEAKRLLGKFEAFLGQFPPTTELAVQFLTQFKDRSLNTKARYSYVLGAFYSWYSGEKLPIKILSKLFRNVLYFNSLEMSSGDLTQVMPGWCVEVGGCIFSRDDLEEGRTSFSVQGFVAFDE